MFDPDWDTLKIFLLVARAQSFNAAAQLMSTSQATVARRITALETELGVTLFHRTPRGIVPTQAAEPIQRLASEMEEKVRLVAASAAQEMALVGRIRISVPEGIGGYWLPPRMKEYHRRYPGVTIDILCSQEPLDIATMEADIFVSTQEPEYPDAVLISSNVMTLKPFASADYLETYGTPRTLDELWKHRLCDFTDYPRTGDWKQWADLVSEGAYVCYRTNSPLALGEATKNGLGISLLPISLQHTEQKLIAMDIPGLTTKLKFWLSCHKATKDIPRIRALIDYIKSEVFLDPHPGSAFYSES